MTPYSVRLVKLNLIFFLASVLLFGLLTVFFFALSCSYHQNCGLIPVTYAAPISGIASLVLFASGNIIAKFGLLKFSAVAFMLFLVVYTAVFLNDRYRKPQILSIKFCSDVCPDYTRSIIIYEGVKTPEECKTLGGLTIRDIAWGGYIGCGPKGLLFWMSEAWR